MKKCIIIIIAVLFSFLGVDTLFATPNTWTQKADFGGAAKYLAVGFSIGGKGYIPNFPEKLYLCHARELDIQGFENIPLRLGHLCEDMTVLPGIFNLGQRLHLLQQFAHRVFLDEFR